MPSRKRRTTGKAAAAVGATPAVASTPASLAAIGGTLKLGSSLSIQEVSECTRTLRQALEAGVSEIDVSALEVIDTAGVQLLLAALAHEQRQGRQLRFSGAHSLLTEVVTALGLSAPFAAATKESM